MSKRVSAFEARTRFGEILDTVRYRKEPVIVERNGRPAAVIVDLESYQAMEGLKEEERFIEEYADERIKGFIAADRLSKEEAQKAKRLLKPGR
ncbi:MAG: type II toxin-antitoxin system Phd/YefM family antitoxin [Candidatus Omnitrophica bacterium]|nr:type II toxin-antitoxin system Phd/YefM family antitoxin [Candidatus Omnitrophota bacterium]